MKYLIFGLSLLALFSYFGCKESQPYKQGERLYAIHCAGCHGDQGEGLQSLYPPLSNSAILRDKLLEVPCIVHVGLNVSLTIDGKVFDQPMPAIPSLNSVEITNIVNFLQGSWGNSGKTLKVEEVDAALKYCQ
ncbi:MAG: cytochrome c [Saprospiraceae bacterium]